MNEFNKYHPVVNFVYFIFIIAYSMIVMHPLFLLISFISALANLFLFSGKKSFLNTLVYIIPLFIFTALINPLFNHQGITILIYFPGGNPLTLESVIYGLCSACMIINVIIWFSIYSKIMTSDKFIYLFGRIVPSLSLILSMTLRFVPRFLTQMKKVCNGQKTIGRDITSGSIIKRVKNGVTVISIMITWALENAIDTADSMKSRGYGLPGRTAFSVYKFDKRDLKACLFIVVLGFYVFVGCILDAVDFTYFPFMCSSAFSFYGLSVYIAYLILCIYPLFIDLWEVKKWNALRSMI